MSSNQPSAYRQLLAEMPGIRRRWLITGVAGFIGSNLLEVLLMHGQEVVGLDNLATGHLANLEDVRSCVGEDRWKAFHFIKGDIRDPQTCRDACKGVQHVLHQAALGSVPRSLEDPLSTSQVNIEGHLNMLEAARDAGVGSFVYAASSSTYGDHPELPKIEEQIGNALSPYAVTKRVNELYAEVFARNYGFGSIGLRYFNIFGRRQDPAGAYAAVIPLWFAAVLNGEPVHINGDGETSRDFCYIDNCIQANLLAATRNPGAGTARVYNVAYGERTTLNALCAMIGRELGVEDRMTVIYREERAGDVRHSLASIGAITADLGYNPSHSLARGLAESAAWYRARLATPERPKSI